MTTIKTPEQIADSIAATHSGSWRADLQRAVRAGIQAAWESWEPEVAIRPSQEQMLRWLEIESEMDTATSIYIPGQLIEKENA